MMASHSALRSYIVDRQGKILRRNWRNLRPTNETAPPAEVEAGDNVD
jgi:hypothetical protein